MFKICIDPGHSGIPDAGAIGPSGLEESDVTLAVGLDVRDMLVAAGYQVIMTRVKDDPATDSLSYRCELANQTGATIFVSIHCNAADSSEAQGTETYYYPGSIEGEPLAQAVQNEMVKLDLADRGIKTAHFYVLKYTEMPAILVETAFISNPQEEKLLAEPDFQRRIANAINFGIEEYFNSKKNEQ